MNTLKITIALIASVICSLTLPAANPFVYNTESREAGTTQIVYKTDATGKYLTPHLKYNFSYDKQNRMQQKEVLRWDSNSGMWVNQHTLSFLYEKNGYSIVSATWNADENVYNLISLKTTYTLDSENRTCRYESFRIDKDTQEWVVTAYNEFGTENRDLYAQN
ncbi:MAG: DUF3836 domain-containing protein [Bacteroides sp.]|nr:DUF3836 domain-containing protein [Bacteroides sp.]